MPWISCIVWVVRPIMVRPELRTMYSREPMMTFWNLALAPPEIGMPPRTRAIRICVSSWLPPEAVTEPTLMTLMNAAKPVMAPASI